MNRTGARPGCGVHAILAASRLNCPEGLKGLPGSLPAVSPVVGELKRTTTAPGIFPKGQKP
jgi:hypothetical protein